MTMDVKDLLAKADVALAAYREKSAAGETEAANAAYADFEAAQKQVEAAIGAQEAAAKAKAAAEALEEARAKARIPVGGVPGNDGQANSVPAIRFKAADGSEQDYRPVDIGLRGRPRFKAADEVRYTDAFRDYLATGQWADGGMDLARAKALSLGVDAAGGFTVASEVLSNELVRQIGNDVLMRRLATVQTLAGAVSLRVNVMDHMDAAEWTSEAGTGTADTSTPFAARSLTPHPLVKKVLISDDLLSLSGQNVEAEVRNEAGYQLAIAEEAGFMTGTGAQQPEGLFVSSLPTDVTATSATDIAYDDLVAVEFALKAQYRNGASWIIHRTILKEIHQIADGTGIPYLRRNPISPATFELFGYPVNESEYAPSSSASTLYVAALGNWRRAYRIVDVAVTEVKRLTELYAATNQVGFFFRRKTDGMVVDGQGCVRLKMNT